MTCRSDLPIDNLFFNLKNNFLINLFYLFGFFKPIFFIYFIGFFKPIFFFLFIFVIFFFFKFFFFFFYFFNFFNFSFCFFSFGTTPGLTFRPGTRKCKYWEGRENCFLFSERY